MAAQIGVEIGRLPGKKQSKAEPIIATVCITLTEQFNPTSHIARSRAMEQVGRWLYHRIGLLAHVLASAIDWMAVPKARGNNYSMTISMNQKYQNSETWNLPLQ